MVTCTVDPQDLVTLGTGILESVGFRAPTPACWRTAW